ncbi:hypothetical protein GCM10009832_11330 [Dietzia kunjamensis subsp. schimae]
MGAGWAVLSAPAAAGLTALVWQFPLVLAGTGGGFEAVPGAIISMALFMTLFSFLAGAAAIGAVGAGAGYLVRERSAVGAAIAGIAVGVLSALIVAVADVYLTG